MPFDDLDREKTGSVRVRPWRGLDPWVAALIAFVLGITLTLWVQGRAAPRGASEK